MKATYQQQIDAIEFVLGEMNGNPRVNHERINHLSDAITTIKQGVEPLINLNYMPPTDAEIEANAGHPHVVPEVWRQHFIKGAKWMRNRLTTKL